MCGIAGAISTDGNFARVKLSSVIQSMVDSMQHRGPDSSGVIAFDLAVFGSCRLAIQDLSPSSNQPLRSPDSECTVVLNGEIFNYVELREELKELGHRFTSEGDTEVLVHAYEEWGIGCLERLNGMFAFAIHDERARTTLIARDRYGIKPLYFGLVPGLFVFASEPIALLRSGLLSPEPNMSMILDYLRFGITDCDSRTFFNQISQLQPGSFLVAGDDGVSMRSWYSLPESKVREASVEVGSEATREFRRRLMDSLRIRMRSSVPVGMLLSGGIDSSSIACLAWSVSNPASLQAFLVSFPGTQLDESQYAKLAADASGVSLWVEPAGEVSQESIVRCLQDEGEPVISPSVVAQWLIMKAINAKGLRVALTGQGADEFLGGYQYMEAYAIRDLIVQGSLGAAARYVLNPRNIKRLPALLAEVLFIHVPSKAKLLRWRKSWLRKPQNECHSDYERELLGCRTLPQMLDFHVRRRLPELLRYEDRNSMAFSVETRHPFLDHTLVEYSLGLPVELIIGGCDRKRILRLAMEGIVPEVILGRSEKVGFQTPANWLSSPEFETSFHTLCQNAPPSLKEAVDFDEACSLLSKRRSSARRNEIWRIYNVLAWLEYIVKPLQTLTGEGTCR